MKKVISLALAFIMAFSVCTVAFAANTEKCTCKNTPIVYVPGFGAAILLDPESDEPKTVYPPNGSDIAKSIPDILLALFAVTTGNEELFGKTVLSAANKLLGKIACDENGVPVYNTSIEPFEYPEEDTHQNVTEYASDRSFDFEYDWRLSPVDNAADLKDFIDYIKELTGHDEVSIMCHSQGNTLVATYLEMYGNEGIEKIAFLSPAFQGISILGSLYRKEADISGKSSELKCFLETIMGDSSGSKAVSLLMTVLNLTGFTDGLLNFLQKYLTSQFDLIYDECLVPAFGNLAGTWSFVPDEYFDDAVEAMFEGREDAPVLEKIMYYHDNVQVKLPEIIQETMDNGTDIIICAGYGISTIPVSKTPAVQSDFLIDTKYMSIGAVCAPLGETLGDDYVQAVDCGHNHVSADLMIDASTCAFPEYTWFIKGMSHSDFTDGYEEFLTWYFESDERIDIHTSEAYPQFMTNDENENLVAVTEPEEESGGIFGFIASILPF